MNRRKFFGALAALAAARWLPGKAKAEGTLKFIPPLKASGAHWVPNPDYVNAEYEIYFFVNPDTVEEFTPIVFKRPASESTVEAARPPGQVRLSESLPLRFSHGSPE